MALTRKPRTSSAATSWWRGGIWPRQPSCPEVVQFLGSGDRSKSVRSRLYSPLVEVSEHLFRHEWGRLVAALTRIFGAHNLALAEDVAQEAFCRAVEVWGYRGMPANPQARLVVTAK